MKINKKIITALYESENYSQSELEEYASYLYNEADGDVNDIPDYEECIDWIVNVDKNTYKKLYKMVKQAIENVSGNMYNGKIELSDNHTLWNIAGNFTPEDFMFYRDEAIRQFEEETGIEMWQDGRSGRHIVVDDNFTNAYHYNELVEAHDKWENWLISKVEEIATEEINESTEIKNPFIQAKVDNGEFNANDIKDYGDYAEVPSEFISKYVDAWTNRSDWLTDGPYLYSDHGKYLSDDGDFYTAVDNSSGDCWVENFKDRETAVKYLMNEIEADGSTLSEALSPNSGFKKISKNIKVMNYKGTYIVLYQGHNEKEFNNEKDATEFAKKLAKKKNELTEDVSSHIDPNDDPDWHPESKRNERDLPDVKYRKETNRKEPTGDIVTSEDLNGSVNFKYDTNEGPLYINCFWSSNEPFDSEEDEAEWEDPEDVWDISYTVYDKDLNEIDGGLLLDYDYGKWDAKELCSNMLGLSGYIDVDKNKITHLENGDLEEIVGE